MDPESRAWLQRLSPGGPDREAALAELHVLLLKGARVELRRRRALGHLPREDDQDDLAQQSADDALLAILGKLDSFRGDSRFTTWAYKFALYEAAAAMRRRSWRGREVRLEPEDWPLVSDERGQGTPESVETAETLAAIQEAIQRDLSPHQREVLVAIVLNDVPIDVLAERLSTTRGALYKTVHDARQKLRAALVAQGLRPDESTAPTP